MWIGEVANSGAEPFGKPLDGVRILAIEQLQSLPFATQLLARLGADVVKVEHPTYGEPARQTWPAITDPEGRSVGATFLRSNLDKRSVGIDIGQAAGRDLVLRLAPHYDVVCENFTPGTMDRLGLGYMDVAMWHPKVIYLSVSGFGNVVPTPYADWPAFPGLIEAMSGLADATRVGDDPPPVGTTGPLADLGAAVFAAVGVLAALRHRDQTNEGQFVDVAAFDAMVALTDLVANLWSMGVSGASAATVAGHAFRAADGWFVVQLTTPEQVATLGSIVGQPGWAGDGRLATAESRLAHLEAVLRPGVEAWAATKDPDAAAADLRAAGLPAAPCRRDDEVAHDPHLLARHMLVAMPRSDGVEHPILIPGNPIKLSKVSEGPERRPPWLGEHTQSILMDELHLTLGDVEDLRARGIVA